MTWHWGSFYTPHALLEPSHQSHWEALSIHLTEGEIGTPSSQATCPGLPSQEVLVLESTQASLSHLEEPWPPPCPWGGG